MRIAARLWHVVVIAMLVLAPLLVFRAGRLEETPYVLRGRSPANNVRPSQPRGLLQQELLGVDPASLILYAPTTGDPGALAVPRP